MRVYDGSKNLVSDRASWCRKADCKYHPSSKLFFGKRSFLRCVSCKHFVAKDNYQAKS